MSRLLEALSSNSRTSLTLIAEHDLHHIAGRKASVVDIDNHAAHERANMPLAIVTWRKFRFARGPDRSKSRFGRAVKLWCLPVAGKSLSDFDRAPLVNPVGANGQPQRPLPNETSNDATLRLQRHLTEARPPGGLVFVAGHFHPSNSSDPSDLFRKETRKLARNDLFLDPTVDGSQAEHLRWDVLFS